MVNKLIRETGESYTMIQYPAPAFGGHVQHGDLVTNVLQLGELRLSPQSVVDVIEQAIGVYETDRTSVKVRTSNPFFGWVKDCEQ